MFRHKKGSFLHPFKYKNININHCFRSGITCMDVGCPENGSKS